MFEIVGLGRAITAVLLLVGALLALGSAPAAADDLDALKGRTIRIVIGAAPSSGADIGARAFATTLRKFVPDGTIRLQNIAGAGGLTAVREIQSARGDTITLVAFGTGPIYAHFTPAVDSPYDVSQLRWIGSLNDNQRVLFIRRGLVGTRFDTLFKLGRQPLATSSDATSSSTIESYVLSAMTGMRLKVVPGVADAVRDTMLMAGDVDVIVSAYAPRRPMVESGVLIPVLRFGEGAYPDSVNALPKIAEVTRPGVPADLVYFMETMNRIAALMAAAPSTGDTDLAALRVAFDRVVADDEFKAQILASGQVVGQPTPGAQLEGMIARLFSGTSDLRSLVKSYIACGQKLSERPDGECG